VKWELYLADAPNCVAGMSESALCHGVLCSHGSGGAVQCEGQPREVGCALFWWLCLQSFCCLWDECPRCWPILTGLQWRWIVHDVCGVIIEGWIRAKYDYVKRRGFRVTLVSVQFKLTNVCTFCVEFSEWDPMQSWGWIWSEVVVSICLHSFKLLFLKRRMEWSLHTTKIFTCVFLDTRGLFIRN
jgi:hypothetical protein